MGEKYLGRMSLKTPSRMRSIAYDRSNRWSRGREEPDGECALCRLTAIIEATRGQLARAAVATEGKGRRLARPARAGWEVWLARVSASLEGIRGETLVDHDAARPMSSLGVPPDRDVYRATAERVDRLLSEVGSVFPELARCLLASDGHVLSEEPRTLWPIVVVRSCVSAGGDWRRALWPAVALECAMAAADAFDDLADGEPTEPMARFGRGPVLTAAAGLLALAGSAVLRATEDGVADGVAIALGQVLGRSLADAAAGQARGLRQRAAETAVADAYAVAAEKSGPLGELAARVGAMVAIADAGLLDQYGTFGWHLGVSSQLINDALDVAPGSRRAKRDVRDGIPTIPLVFAGSAGAPTAIEGEAIVAWEAAERERIAAEGGIILAEVLAIAERVRAEEALATLATAGHAVDGLRALLKVRDSDRC